MGKADDEQSLPTTVFDDQGTTRTTSYNNGCCLGCSTLQKLVTFRCVLVFILGAGVLLSAVFWLPFFHFGDQKDLDLDYEGYDIVASFMLKKPASFLQDYRSQLEGDIFDEMSFSNTKVEIISLESLAGSNVTKVVFAVESDVTTQSLIRESFVTLITRQSFLRLTSASLFGDPFSFEVLKFRGGITAIPDQKAYLMQNVQILFNFTLNFSIDQVVDNFAELTSQLKTGLHLTPYENLYLRLTNLKGSTITPPTTVQSQVLLAVGINPSKSRLKQLAQTISGSHAKNLGLNNTVFGRVKQVRLSSILQHSLGSDGRSPSPSPSPLPSPSPSPSSESHHHHHHHHHYHHDVGPAPDISPSPSTGSGGSIIRKRSPTSAPVPAPAPGKNRAAEPPCRFGYNNPWNHNKHPHVAPSAPPVYPPHAGPSQKKIPSPKISSVPAKSPLPNVAYAHSQPPSTDEFHAGPRDVLPLVSPSPSPSSADVFPSNLMALPKFHSTRIAFVAAENKRLCFTKETHLLLP